MADFSHLNEHGDSQMVDVGAKTATRRLAQVTGQLSVSADCATCLTPDAREEIVRTARIAAVQAAKKTAELIPYCHQIPLSQVKVSIDWRHQVFHIATETSSVGTTGVEMEALVAAQIAAATIYDMIKAKDPLAVLGPFRLDHKSGGKSDLDRKH